MTTDNQNLANADTCTAMPTKLFAKAWCNHSKTTVGYTDQGGKFIALADCSIGPDYAATYEPLASTFAAAPDLLAALERVRKYLRSKKFDPGMRDAVAADIEAAIYNATYNATGGAA